MHCRAARPRATKIDADGDGVVAALDCNDHDPAVYPGAPELCDFQYNGCVEDSTITQNRGQWGYGLYVEDTTAGVPVDVAVSNTLFAGNANFFNNGVSATLEHWGPSGAMQSTAVSGAASFTCDPLGCSSTP